VRKARLITGLFYTVLNISVFSMRRIRLKMIKVALIAIILIVVFLFLYLFTPEPPVAIVREAVAALGDARSRNARSYSPKTFRQAEQYYDSAMYHWDYQNNRFLLFRDYDEVIRYAGLSALYSARAIDQAGNNSSSLRLKLGQKIGELNELVKTFNARFNRYPLSNELRKMVSRGKLLLSEGEIAYAKGSYLQANIKLSEADPLLRESFDSANDHLTEYFESYVQWKKWYDDTVSETKKQRSYAVIVDKFAGKCYLYHIGTRIQEFDAELGRKWIGDKRHQGDNATPEGRYRVTKKLEGGSTKYYKALMLDYPNEEDRKRFAGEKENGTLPQNARIGGLIEIHGHGGKGSDWTEGCVALGNSDMDKLFRQVKVGTPVTIIGSEKDLATVKRTQ
jgi:hypothetical protein